MPYGGAGYVSSQMQQIEQKNIDEAHQAGVWNTMVVDIMVPSHSVIRSHKKKIESSPSMIFPQGMVTS
jgi:hypothetical protein